SGTMEWGPYKDVEWTGSYKEGKKDGEFELTYKPPYSDRYVSCFLNYKDGIEDGDGYEWVGDSLWRGKYVHGIKEGKWELEEVGDSYTKIYNALGLAYHRQTQFRTYEHGVLEGDYRELMPAQPKILLPAGEETGIYHDGKKEGDFKRIIYGGREYLYEAAVGGETKDTLDNITGTYQKDLVVRLGNCKVTYTENGDAYVETKKGTYLNGQKSGIWTEDIVVPADKDLYPLRAYMTLSGEYRDGKRQGVWKGEGGFMTFKDDRWEGDVQCLARRDRYTQVSQTGKIKNAKFSGVLTTTTTSRDGRRVVEFFENGKRTGYEKYINGELYEKGSVTASAKSFFSDHGTDILVELYEDGTLSEAKTIFGLHNGYAYTEYRKPEFLIPGTEHVFYNPDSSIKERRYVVEGFGSGGREISEEEYDKIHEKEKQEEIQFMKRAEKAVHKKIAEGKKEKEKTGKSKLRDKLKTATKDKRLPQNVNGGNNGNTGGM
ncbi:MAG: hypothetical protein II942_03015, partial [Alphaproteobacteria bacterium]|nr:hypothetical protein [Alphaproteobacteria bacterium]